MRATLATDDGGVVASPGEVGDGYLFDGVNDRVLVGNPAQLALTGSLSIEAWVRVDVANSYGMILFRGEPSGGLEPYFLGLQNGALVFHVEDTSGPAVEFVASGSPLAVGTLTHVAATLDGTTGDVHLYIDGSEVLAGNTAVRPLGPIVSGGGVVVGNTIDGGATNAFDGIIDELSTYSKALTPTQVQSIYAAGAAGTCGVAGQGQVQFTTATVVVNESVGTVQLSVIRTGNQNGAAQVDWQTADGTATNPSDYLSAGSTLSWGDKDVSVKVVNVSVVNDTDYETSRETFAVNLLNPVGAILFSRRTATVYINGPNDNPGTIQFNSPNFNGYENFTTPTLATITVTRNGGSAGAVDIDWATTTGGTATAGSDYTAASGTLNWGDGDGAPKSFTVTVLGDLVAEPTETVNLALSNLVGVAFLGPRQTSVLTLVDSPGKFSFSPSSITIDEDAGVVTVTVGRLQGRGGVASVDYTTVVSGSTATAGSDYTAVNGTLIWGAGDLTSKTFTIPIINDALVEGAETINIALSNPLSYPTNYATLGVPSTATVTINPSDVKGVVQFDLSNYFVSEGAGSVVVNVTRTGTPTTASVVSFVLEDIFAQSGFDYGPSSTPASSLSWGATETGTKTITVPILEDTENELNETFRLRLTSATGDTFGSRTTTTVQINDNDLPGQIKWSSPNYFTSESVGSVTILVSRAGGSAGIVEADFALTNVSTTSSDYGTPTPALTVTFGDGDAADKAITIPITSGDGAEAQETFKATLTALRTLSGAKPATFGSPTVTTIFIAANGS